MIARDYNHINTHKQAKPLSPITFLKERGSKAQIDTQRGKFLHHKEKGTERYMTPSKLLHTLARSTKWI